MDKKCVLVGVHDMVWYHIEGVEVTLTHQRYQPMEEIDLDVISGMKDELDRVE